MCDKLISVGIERVIDIEGITQQLQFYTQLYQCMTVRTFVEHHRNKTRKENSVNKQHYTIYWCASLGDRREYLNHQELLSLSERKLRK